MNDGRARSRNQGTEPVMAYSTIFVCEDNNNNPPAMYV